MSGQDCFMLKLEASTSALKSRSSANVEIIRHTIWGYFSQRTGLLIQLHDTHLLKIRTPGNNNTVFWETAMESLIRDYRTIEGINIAHSGRTVVSLLRYAESPEKHTRTRMEEIWSIEEVDFNVKGLRIECFLPPGDLQREDEECGNGVGVDNNEKLESRGLNSITNNSYKNGNRSMKRVVAVEEDDDLGVLGDEERLL